VSDERVARDLVVHGRVQGVFYRDSCRREARSAGVDGWVTNASDGTVRAHLEGPPDAVDRVAAWARRGPRGADVERVDERDAEPDGSSGFEVR
jgi:acylphosphatase